MWLLLLANFAFAQSLNCLQLENINIGCVSSIDHSCKRNLAIDDPKAACTYVGEPSVSYRVEGPISFVCKSYKNTQICDGGSGNNDQTGTNCRTVSECLEYFPPTCKLQCVPCFNRVETHQIGTTRGCIVCTRKPCPDEKIRTTCPTSYDGMPLGPNAKCSSNQVCPETKLNEKTGTTHAVTVIKGVCEPPELPIIQPPMPPPELCVWKVDKRSSTGCEPIEPDNQN